MSVTRLGPAVPLMNAGLGYTSQVPSGGASGQVTTSDGSNAAYWGENVARISSNGSNALVGPFVSIAAGSNVLLTLDSGPGGSFPSNTLRIHSTGGGGGGNLVTSNGSNSLAAVFNLKAGVGVALGVSGQDITITNTGVPGPAGPAALVLLQTLSASASSSLDFQSWYSSTYDDYLFEILNLVPATANVDLFVRFGNAGSYDSGGSYSNTTYSQSTADGNVSTGAAGTTAMKLRNAAVIDSNTNGGVTGSLKLWYPGSTTTFRRALLDCSYLDGDPEQARTWCEYTGGGTSIVNSVRFLFSSGNITSGIIRAYGIAK